MPSRRRFIWFLSLMGAAAVARADAGPLDPADPAAAAQGFVADAAKADKAKYPKYAVGQVCGNCALYQGGSAAAGPCPIFQNRQVPAKGWCNVYVKKA